MKAASEEFRLLPDDLSMTSRDATSSDTPAHTGASFNLLTPPPHGYHLEEGTHIVKTEDVKEHESSR